MFHTNAGYLTLHDAAYNVDRMVTTRHPYEELLVDLVKREVQVELCRATPTVQLSAELQEE